MNGISFQRVHLVAGLLATFCASSLSAQESAVKPDQDGSSPSRLEFLRNVVGKIAISPTDPGDPRELTFKAQPILRYSDPARKIADSAVWRVGAKGRPIALVTSEIYGPFGPAEGRSYQLNHEFLAIDKPHLTMQCGAFTWAPPAESALTFQKFKTDERPAATPQLRLVQMKRLAQKFTLREFHLGNQIELRLLPTPLDRYEPSAKPLADGTIFAGVWGVNPELLLFIESDGESWSYGFARSGSAKLWAILDDAEVWGVPSVYVTPVMAYSIAVNPATIPATLFDDPSAKKEP
ncbi:hypothetical protein [Planctellipticum variicoloris]|uniref:hypothetical protein n=1 Tax=Planctellipticum variicoloris TaxID=3064265 RepID=UPI0030139D1C|nr:hypothetical protein SH412_002072 [Planctomycetaceae bacterium SH412]